MNSELEENRELADNRLIELQKLQQDLQSVHQENNNMKVPTFNTASFRLKCFDLALTDSFKCISFHSFKGTLT